MDKCQSCNREFKKIRDYPLVYVARFERIDIPKNLQFPIERSGPDYVEPDSPYSNPRAPEAVLDYFKKNSEEKTLEYDGWTWNRKENSFGLVYYTRSTNDARNLILSYINPYLNKLEELIGQEVLSSKALPKFSQNKNNENNLFEIPETHYYLRVEEVDEQDKDFLSRRGFVFLPDLISEQGKRKAILEIIEFRESIRPLPPLAYIDNCVECST